ncbi:MAG: hypothetical protein FWH57_02965 [Oscillospiraceae bacterium]|nr:hypothetical protein [Oscillospiraceae bacterium]
MFEALDFNHIDNANNISKNCEMSMKRLREQWAKVLASENETEFYEKYSIRKNVIDKKYKDGQITLRIAAALAMELSLNPYFITCDSDDFTKEYSEELLHQFLTENGYVKPPDPPEPSETDPNETNGAANSADNVPLKEAGNATEGANGVGEKALAQKLAETPVEYDNPYVEILRERIEKKILEMSPDELKKIESIAEKNAIELVKSLYLRSEYDEDIKRIAAIVKLALLL